MSKIIKLPVTGAQQSVGQIIEELNAQHQANLSALVLMIEDLGLAATLYTLAEAAVLAKIPATAITHINRLANSLDENHG